MKIVDHLLEAVSNQNNITQLLISPRILHVILLNYNWISSDVENDNCMFS